MCAREKKNERRDGGLKKKQGTDVPFDIDPNPPMGEGHEDRKSKDGFVPTNQR